jgi:hypothetical protein
MYQPDGIHVVSWNNVDYVLTANEGSSKEYDENNWSEESRVADLVLTGN